ncbi:MAG: hypothetical protein IKV77_05175 [Alistipes sp.]|nr:hypothetical protein [Bacteroidales bacterium]MBR5492503.1 hypothetical protein [Alistipes sp.]MBR5920046.1 hypothetical protein [Bacteroidales bacterium]
MTKQAKNTEPQGEVEKPKRERKVDLQATRIPYWLTEKADDELTSWEQLVVYCWIYDHNGFAIRNGGNIYGKHTYDTYWREITRDLNIKKPGVVIDKLKKAGWIQESWAAPFKGKTMKGYRCLLDKHQRVEVQAEQQELMLEEFPDEEANVVESSAQGDGDNGELYQYGLRFYYDSDGQMVQVPMSAPARPTKTAVWSSDPEGWYEPEELPGRELEY